MPIDSRFVQCVVTIKNYRLRKLFYSFQFNGSNELLAKLRERDFTVKLFGPGLEHGEQLVNGILEEFVQVLLAGRDQFGVHRGVATGLRATHSTCKKIQFNKKNSQIK